LILIIASNGEELSRARTGGDGVAQLARPSNAERASYVLARANGYYIVGLPWAGWKAEYFLLTSPVYVSERSDGAKD
jgi:hypothetical protein